MRHRGTPQLYALVDQGCLSASTFLATALIARSGGLDVLGAYTVAWMTMLLVNAVQGAVIVAPMASLAPSDAGSAATFFGHFARAERRLLSYVLGLGSAIALGAALVAPRVTEEITAAAIAVLSYQVFDFVRRFRHAQGQHASAVRISAGFAVLHVVLLAVTGGSHGLTAATSLVCTAVALGAVSAGPALAIDRLGRRTDTQQALSDRSWRSSKWLVGSALMQWTCGNLFLLLAPAFVSLAGLGALRAAQSIVGIANVWLQGLENVVPREAGRLWREAGQLPAVQYLARVAVVWTAITAALMTAIAAGAEGLLHAVSGPGGAAYPWVLQWYALLQVLVLLGLPLRSLLRAAEKTKGIFSAYIAASVFSVITVVPLLTAYGMAGALMGLTGAQIVFQAVLVLHIRRDLAPSHGRGAMGLSTT